MKKFGVIFPGQGTQVVGMGQSLVERYSFVQDLYFRASAILGYDLAELCATGPIEKLTESRYAQPALFVHQLAAARALRELGKSRAANLAMGLSIGELTALVVADVLDFETGLRVVKKRGELIQLACEKNHGGMASVLGATVESVEKLCRVCGVEMSNINCPGQIVISGEKLRIEAAVAQASEITGGKAVELNVAGAFHSSLMEPARVQFEQFLENVVFRKPGMAVISNVTGEVVEDAHLIKKLLAQQIVSPVRWWDCMNAAKTMGVTRFYQCGSGKTLVNMAKRIDPELVVVPFGECGDIVGLPEDW